MFNNNEFSRMCTKSTRDIHVPKGISFALQLFDKQGILPQPLTWTAVGR